MVQATEKLDKPPLKPPLISQFSLLLDCFFVHTHSRTIPILHFTLLLDLLWVFMYNREMELPLSTLKLIELGITIQTPRYGGICHFNKFSLYHCGYKSESV
jgi:hypothetical protein